MLIYNKDHTVKSVIKSSTAKLSRPKITAANKVFLKSIGLKLAKNVANK